MGKRRYDAADTIDSATHFLHHLQSEGWGLASMECDVQYAAPGLKGKQIPIGATVVVHLTPAWEG